MPSPVRITWRGVGSALVRASEFAAIGDYLATVQRPKIAISLPQSHRREMLSLPHNMNFHVKRLKAA